MDDEVANSARENNQYECSRHYGFYHRFTRRVLKLKRYRKFLRASCGIGFLCCCYSIFLFPSKLAASEQLETGGKQSCISVRGHWQGVLLLVNHGQQAVTATVGQEDCDISIQTSSGLPYGQYFTGHISSENELLVYDMQTGEDWTSYVSQATVTSFTIYDYVNDFSELDKLQLTKIFYKGDIDNNYVVDLRDAILIAQILTNTTTSTPYFVEADVNGDNKLGMAEIVFILQELSQ